MPVNTRRCLQFLVIGRHRPRQSVDAAVSYVRHTAWSVCVGRVEQERINRSRSRFAARVGARNFHHRLFAVCRHDFVGVPRGNWEEVIYRAYACDQIRLSAKVDAITKMAVRYVLMRPFCQITLHTCYYSATQARQSTDRYQTLPPLRPAMVGLFEYTLRCRIRAAPVESV